MARTSRFVFILTTAALLVSAVAPARADEISLQVGVTGSNSLQGLRDPVTVARRPEVSALLQSIADEPRSAEYIEQSLDDSEVNLALLLELGLLKAWHDSYAIGFNYLTIEDHELLVTTLTPFAASLAGRYRERWREFEAMFGAYDAAEVPAGEVAYAVIGAMSLDWDGLEITAEKGLRITAGQLLAGSDFITWAKEKSSESNVRELYWGSHNTVAGGIQFTTFGDHYTLPRMGLPDLLWRINGRMAQIDGVPDSIGKSLRSALAPYYLDDFLSDAGAILRLLRSGAATGESVSASTEIPLERTEAILGLLEDLHYLHASESRYYLAHPYFSRADKAMLDGVRALSRELIEDWLDRNGPAVRDSLASLTALRYGVPYRQLFTEIWHYLFGLANRALVESGHFADPYAEERISGGMIPFTFDADLLQPLTAAGN